MDKNNLYCAALLIADNTDGIGSGYCKQECTIEQLEQLKKHDDLGYIILVGWVPIEFYYGGDIDQRSEDFICF